MKSLLLLLFQKLNRIQKSSKLEELHQKMQVVYDKKKDYLRAPKVSKRGKNEEILGLMN